MHLAELTSNVAALRRQSDARRTIGSRSDGLAAGTALALAETAFEKKKATSLVALKSFWGKTPCR